MKLVLILISAFVCFNVVSAELDGIKFDDSVKLENVNLTLNGIGIRKATILKLKVYYGAFYTSAKNQNANSVVNSSGPKQIIMNFVRDVDANKIRGGFSDGFKNANKNADSFKSYLDAFNATMSDMVSGDRVIVRFLTDGVSVNVKGKEYEKIGNTEFSKALLSIWFINPTDEGLTKGLLGL